MYPDYYAYPQPYYVQGEPYPPYRETPQVQSLERRFAVLETQHANHVKELTRINEELKRQNNEIRRLNGEINRINQELTRLSNTNVTQSRRLNRLNQRLRVVENRLTIPFKPTESGF